MFITSPGRCICLPYVFHMSSILSHRRCVLFLLYLAPAFDYLFCACKTNLPPACEHGQRRPRYRAPNFNPSLGPAAPRLQGGAMRPPSQARCIVTSCAAITESRSTGGSGPLQAPFPGNARCRLSSSHCVFMPPSFAGFARLTKSPQRRARTAPHPSGLPDRCAALTRSGFQL